MLAQNRNIIVCIGVLIVALANVSFVGKKDAQAFSITTAKNVRIAGDLKKTRFVVELSRVLKPKASILINPYRVVIDLPQIDFQIRENDKHKNNGLIKGFRYGLFTEGKSRLVIDTKKPVKIHKLFTLRPNKNNPARLVVDIVAVSHEQMQEIIARENQRHNSQNVNIQEKNNIIIKLLERNSLNIAKKSVIVIDPGHGGIDPGAVGKNNVLEKNIVLEFAKKLKLKLEKNRQYDVYLTRSKDNFVSLDNRIKIARKYKADLFLSLHIDAIDKKNKSIRGITVYNLSKKASDTHAEKLARRENKSDLIAGLDIITASTHVRSIIIDLAQRESKIYSEKFSQILVRELVEHKVLNKNPRRSAGFHVLKAPDIPSILIELGYISNSQDRKRLVSNKYRNKIVSGIVKSIDSYFRKYKQYSENVQN